MGTILKIQSCTVINDSNNHENPSFNIELTIKVLNSSEFTGPGVKIE